VNSSKSSALTKSQVNRAGRILRKTMRMEAIDEDVARKALQVVVRFREAHQPALAKATLGLRSIVRTVGCDAEISQRLKRMNTIIDKLDREPTMALSSMQDIGGCRAVVGALEDLDRIDYRLRRNRRPSGYADYVRNPRRSGYRAVHVVVSYGDRNGDDRRIEVQLRTNAMHEWAIIVERLGARLNTDVKEGKGPPEIIDLLNLVSRAMAIEERGGVVPGDLLLGMQTLRSAAAQYLRDQP
jgi:ppGpp synthetase/RelA/SpoT-type nucleotidyltranferase